MYNFSKHDIKEHIEKNKTIYLVLLFCFFIGLIAGLIIVISKASYFGLLNIKDKNMINIINGNVSLISDFWDCFLSFMFPLILIFLFSLNYYLSFVNFVIFSYQSTLLFLTCMALVESYSFLGFIKMLLLILPVNILYFLIMAFWLAACAEKAKISHKYNSFSMGFDYGFKLKVYISLIGVLVLSIVVGFILPLVLKTAIFIIF